MLFSVNVTTSLKKSLIENCIFCSMQRTETSFDLSEIFLEIAKTNFEKN